MPVVTFQFACDVVDLEGQLALEVVAATLRRHPGLRVLVAGHARPGAPPGFGAPLSQARAARVRLALQEKLAGDPAWDEAPGLGVRRGGYSVSFEDFDDVAAFYIQRTIGGKLQARGVWSPRAEYANRLPAGGEDGQCAQLIIIGFDEQPEQWLQWRRMVEGDDDERDRTRP